MAKQYDTGFLKKLGQRIAALRKRAGFSQETLAEKASVHRTYIGFVEQGKRNPTADNLNKIARALGVSVADIFLEADGASLVMESKKEK
jgi:XRE family transcriptional regulator, regulator of sulfur utilization